MADEQHIGKLKNEQRTWTDTNLLLSKLSKLVTNKRKKWSQFLGFSMENDFF